jgi:hypothetical protein
MSAYPQYWGQQTQYPQVAQAQTYATNPPVQYGQTYSAGGSLDSASNKGNNKWGSAGTTKCRNCRERHKKCVIVGNCSSCSYCHKVGQQCIMELAPKQQERQSNGYKSADMASINSQDCDLLLSDIVRQAEAQYPGTQANAMLQLVADGLGYTLVAKSTPQVQELQLSETTYGTQTNMGFGTDMTYGGYVNPQYIFSQPTPGTNFSGGVFNTTTTTATPQQYYPS